MHFLDQLFFLHYPDKENIVFPLGIPDIDEQTRIIEKEIVDSRHRKPNLCKQDPALKSKVTYLNNQSRYSGENLDYNMVQALIYIYGKNIQVFKTRHDLSIVKDSCKQTKKG